jgi:hypothetical protein
MNEQERTKLLAERAQIQQEINTLKAELQATGEQFSKLGKVLQERPEAVHFSNSPDEHKQTGGIRDEFCFNFQLLSVMSVLERAQSLRKKIQSSEHIRLQLGT